MKREIYIFNDREELADRLVADFNKAIQEKASAGEPIFFALSGGSTPRLFFEKLTKPPYLEGISWKDVNLFWGDERCVPPDDSESNYKMAHDAFISRIDIPEENVHRIIGENPPEFEAYRYADEIQNNLSSKNGFPQFDWIYLGMGTDGHTASLFPNAPTLAENKEICVVAEHPQTGQKRISLTLPVINNAKRVSFLVAGEEKAPVLKDILENESTPLPYPASKVYPEDGVLEWYVDKAAASGL